jgi:hypothetical protein
MYENGKMRHVAGMRGGSLKENDEGSEFNYDKF